MQNHLALPHPPRNWRRGFALGAGVLLLLPIVAMAFTTEVAWGPGDFLAGAGLLAALWLGIEIVWRVLPAASSRALGIAAVVMATMVIWADLAIAIF